MKYYENIFLVFLGALIFSLHAVASDVDIVTNPYKNTIRIGEPIQVDITLTGDIENAIRFPQFSGDTLSKHVELFAPASIDTLYANSSDSSSFFGYTYQFQVTSFDSGLWTVPAIPFLYADDTLYSEPFYIEVSTVAVDTSKNFAPIVPPLAMPYTWREIAELIVRYGGYAYGALLVLAIVVFLLGKNPKKQIDTPVPTPTIPAHEIALERLHQLESDGLLDKGAIKAFHVQLTDIIKEYIENRYHIQAKESTTDELKHALKQLRLPTELRQTLIQRLRLSDLVKFAKAIPANSENQECLQVAYHLIQETQENSPNPPSGDE